MGEDLQETRPGHPTTRGSRGVRNDPESVTPSTSVCRSEVENHFSFAKTVIDDSLIGLMTCFSFNLIAVVDTLYLNLGTVKGLENLTRVQLICKKVSETTPIPPPAFSPLPPTPSLLRGTVCEETFTHRQEEPFLWSFPLPNRNTFAIYT